MILNIRSEKNLSGVNQSLVKVIRKAAELSLDDNFTFTVTCGIRTIEEQKVLVKKGLSKTMSSRHLTGHAVDLALFINNKLTWDFKEYKKISDIVKKAAKELNIEVVWGGDWITFKDGPHFEVNPNKYK